MRLIVALLSLALAPMMAAAQPRAPAPVVKGGAHAFSFEGLMGGAIDLSAYRGKAILVVNTASKCGLTPQYKGLQALHDAESKNGLVIVGVPSGDFAGQEFGSAKEIAQFCELNYGVTFPMAAKAKVTGEAAHPFYIWAKAQAGEAAVPKWNFHKVLIGKDGAIAATFSSRTAPDAAEVRAAVRKALVG